MKKASNSRSQKFLLGAWVAICASLFLASQALGGEITSIDTFDDGMVIQRVGHTGTLHLSGQFSGKLSSIQARVLSKTSGKKITSWKKIEFTTETNQWAGTLAGISEGGWYCVEVKAGTRGDVIETDNGFGVGVVIAFIGQSNLQMNFTPWLAAKEIELKKWNPLCSVYNASVDAWGNAYSNIVSGGIHWDTNHYWNVGAYFAQIVGYNLANELEIPVGLVSGAWGGTRIEHWTGKNTYFDYLNHGPDIVWGAFAAALKHAGGDAELVVWHQGYSDLSTYPDSPNGYEDELDVLYSRLKELIPRETLPIICGVEGRRHLNLTNEAALNQELNRIQGESEDRCFDNVRWSQMRWANKHPYVYHGPNALDIRLKNTGHFQNRDRVTWASKMTQCILYVMGRQPDSAGGIFFDENQSTIDGNVITLKVNHQGGDELRVPFPDKPIDGFLVSEDGFASYLPIRSTEIIQPDTVKIILEKTPTRDVYYSYLTGKCPIFDVDVTNTSKDCMEVASDIPPGNLLYDNATLPYGNLREEMGLGCMVNGTIGRYKISTETHPIP